PAVRMARERHEDLLRAVGFCGLVCGMADEDALTARRAARAPHVKGARDRDTRNRRLRARRAFGVWRQERLPDRLDERRGFLHKCHAEYVRARLDRHPHLVRVAFGVVALTRPEPR